MKRTRLLTIPSQCLISSIDSNGHDGQPREEAILLRSRFKSYEMSRRFLVLLVCLVLSSFEVSVAAAAANIPTSNKQDSSKPSSYGVDVSFPIFHSVSTNYPWLPHNQNKNLKVPEEYKNVPLQPLGNRQYIYHQHLEACRRHDPENSELCDVYEFNRLTMNLRQPSSMVNYTRVGFKKIKAPEQLTKVIEKFWKHNHYKGEEEEWPEGNSYFNYWEAPTYLISVDDTSLRGSGPELKKQIWEASAATLEEWTGQELQPCSLYGIRVYGEGSIMLPHVDRLPLVASAMIPVAQKIDEPWPLEVYDHDGNAHNITLTPGEMFLFESHSVIHGRPFPLKGEFVALIFIHFEPTGTSLHRDSAGVYRKGATIDEHYRQSVQKGIGGPSATGDGLTLPPYIIRESAEVENWKEDNPDGWVPPETVLSTEAHVAAKSGNLEKLAKELEDLGGDREASQKLLSARDENGWQVLHQGVTSGNKDLVELLVKHGAGVNSRTHGGYGETPLRIAEKLHGRNHPIVQYLKGLGALSLGPEL